MTAREIIAEWLREHGYDGLYDDCGSEGCGCEIDDLAPCEGWVLRCQPGYRRESDDADFDFCIGPEKEAT